MLNTKNKLLHNRLLIFFGRKYSSGSTTIKEQDQIRTAWRGVFESLNDIDKYYKLYDHIYRFEANTIKDIPYNHSIIYLWSLYERAIDNYSNKGIVREIFTKYDNLGLEIIGLLSCDKSYSYSTLMDNYNCIKHVFLNTWYNNVINAWPTPQNDNEELLYII